MTVVKSVPRRAVFAVLAVPLVPACTAEPKQPPPPDPLAALAEQARKDAAAATALAQSSPELAAVAGEVAKARTAHAVALQTEVDRERPPKTSGSAPPPSSGAPAVAATKQKMADALKAAEKQAGDLVPAVSRYRAGLLGSIAAGCASLREVI
ncbi:hypothetical protein [Kibdelosporangium phytohabitans]|uniref:Uncharacterized protein n=1 Tax=Kibdelosporangium phytohabitans TaxID=860235 RepID=A0A0N9I973_9PSEU|nr:hypothetical protein [Kibdelosporangium phytohabitans]ALG12952.1 hypothetical protein AOZ06_44300 [Kibdelosporangium phytohabitans]MBE1464665.1 hypothetical protein [Kibdelosporangium phytohabitans]